MTLLLHPTPPQHPSRAAHDQLLLATEASPDPRRPHAARIVAYERDAAAKTLAVPLSALTESAAAAAAASKDSGGSGSGSGAQGRVLIRHDVLDTRIAICAPECLFQFQDNFDYADVPAFVRGVVHEEILGAKVAAFVLPADAGAYAARVNSWRQYRALTRDVVQRWTYPLGTKLLAPRPRPRSHPSPPCRSAGCEHAYRVVVPCAARSALP